MRSLFARRCDPRGAIVGGRRSRKSKTIGLPLSPFDRAHPDYEGLLDAARSRLGDEAAWEAALDEGRAMTPEEAADCALGTERSPRPRPRTMIAPPCSPSAKPRCLRLVAQGMTNPQVAQRLYLSPRTVGQHLRSVYRKLGVTSRAAAAREALERGLI